MKFKKAKNPTKAFHDQWDAIDCNALVRNEGDSLVPLYVAYWHQKRLGSFSSLSRAKGAIEEKNGFSADPIAPSQVK